MLFTIDSIGQNQPSLSIPDKEPIETPKNAFHLDFGTVGFGLASNIN